MAERRALTFASLDRVMPDVDVLLEGHTTVGNWSLAQICNHLTFGIVGSVEGYPDRAPWVIRTLIGPVVLRKILKEGRMSPGVKVPAKYLPKAALDARAEAEALRAALRLYAANTAPLAYHPLFGHRPREVWDQIHRIHCAHHLSFVLPKGRG